MMSNIHMHPDQIADLIQKGVAAEFESMIKQRLQEMVDPIISKMSRDIADSIALKVHAMKTIDAHDPWGKTVVHLAFNSKDIQYTTESK